MFATLISLIIAYLLGSVSAAIIVCRLAGTVDPRTSGSGNPGATNVLRLAGKKLAVITLIGDALKGLLAVLIGRIFELHGFELGLVGLAAFLGHLYPLYFRFQGGKGVATLLGVLLGLSLGLGLVSIITWLVLAVVFRYSSLAALITAILSPIYALLFASSGYFIPLVIMAAFLVWRHWDNIQRLREGTESKIEI